MIKTNRKPQARFWAQIGDLGFYVDQPPGTIEAFLQSQDFLTPNKKMSLKAPKNSVKKVRLKDQNGSRLYFKKSVVFPLFQSQGWGIANDEEFLFRASLGILEHFCARQRLEMKEFVGVAADIYGVVIKDLFQAILANDPSMAYAEKMLTRLASRTVPPQQIEHLRTSIPQHIRDHDELKQGTPVVRKASSLPRL